MATICHRSWDSPRSLFKRVNSTPAKSKGTFAYAVDLSTNVVSDALLAKTLGMCVRTAVNASHNLDPEKSAKIARVYLELCEISGNQSKLHMHTVGELGTKAKAGCSIDRRQFSIYETKATQRMANVYFYAKGLDSSDQTKELVAEWLCKKSGVSSEGMQVGEWRIHKSMGIVGGVVLVMPDHLQATVLRLGTPVDGTSNVKNAQISIDNEDVNALLLAPETTTVYVGGSVAVLKDALNKGGQDTDRLFTDSFRQHDLIRR